MNLVSPMDIAPTTGAIAVKNMNMVLDSFAYSLNFVTKFMSLTEKFL